MYRRELACGGPWLCPQPKLMFSSYKCLEQTSLHSRRDHKLEPCQNKLCLRTQFLPQAAFHWMRTKWTCVQRTAAWFMSARGARLEKLACGWPWPLSSNASFACDVKLENLRLRYLLLYLLAKSDIYERFGQSARKHSKLVSTGCKLT